MWDRVKKFLGARGESATDDAIQRVGWDAETPEHLSRELQSVDEEVESGDALEALGRIRALLCEYPARVEVLQRAAVVLDRVGEGRLASLFEDAMTQMNSETLANIALTFCELSDPKIAMSFAGAARRLGGPDDAAAAGALARVLAREGHHRDVLDVLDRFNGRWFSDVALHTYAMAAILTGDSARWNQVAAAVGQTQDGAGLVRAAARAGAFGSEESAPHRLRHSHFLQYGSVLLDGREIVSEVEVDATRMGELLDLAVIALQAVRVKVDRFASGTPRGEVLARWLGEMTDTPTIPISSRLPTQRVALVVADDADLLEVIQRGTKLEDPVIVIQLVRDPACTMTPVADVIGCFGAEVSLPLAAAVASGPDRVPPSILLRQLRESADEGASGESASDLHEWVAAHARWLSVGSPPSLSERLIFEANIPAWVRVPVLAPEAPQHMELEQGQDLLLDSLVEEVAPEPGPLFDASFDDEPTDRSE